MFLVQRGTCLSTAHYIPPCHVPACLQHTTSHPTVYLPVYITLYPTVPCTCLQHTKYHSSRGPVCLQQRACLLHTTSHPSHWPACLQHTTHHPSRLPTCLLTASHPSHGLPVCSPLPPNLSTYLLVYHTHCTPHYRTPNSQQHTTSYLFCTPACLQHNKSHPFHVATSLVHNIHHPLPLPAYYSTLHPTPTTGLPVYSPLRAIPPRTCLSTAHYTPPLPRTCLCAAHYTPPPHGPAYLLHSTSLAFRTPACLQHI